jgi:hypothetical protein
MEATKKYTKKQREQLAAAKRDIEAKQGRTSAVGAADRVTMYGYVVHETAKAILFDIKKGDGFGKTWFPKSIAQVWERALGPLDSISVPAAFWQRKCEEKMDRDQAEAAAAVAAMKN